MGLIITPQQKTVLDDIKLTNTTLLNQMKLSARNLFQMTWHNPKNTPQEVMDLLGVDAAKAFQAHSGLQQLIYLVDPTWVPLVPTHEYVVNQDGSVTIGAKL